MEAHDKASAIHIAYGVREHKDVSLYDEGSICVSFTAFGVDEICRQVDSRFDGWGSMDQSYWKIGADGNFVPGHRHVLADTSFTIINGTCQFWVNRVKSRGVFDPQGLRWEAKEVVVGPGTMYIGRGTSFAWGCSSDTHLWFLNSGSAATGGIPFALATQVFSETGQLASEYPGEVRGAVERVSELYNTFFLPEALDAVFGPSN